MKRREIWKAVLESEVARLSALSCDALVDAMPNLECYTVKRDGREYQVEVQLLEQTNTYVHVMVAVDDGSLPASLIPSTATFVVERSSRR